MQQSGLHCVLGSAVVWAQGRARGGPSAEVSCPLCGSSPQPCRGVGPARTSWAAQALGRLHAGLVTPAPLPRRSCRSPAHVSGRLPQHFVQDAAALRVQDAQVGVHQVLQGLQGQGHSSAGPRSARPDACSPCNPHSLVLQPARHRSSPNQPRIRHACRVTVLWCTGWAAVAMHIIAAAGPAVRTCSLRPVRRDASGRMMSASWRKRL